MRRGFKWLVLVVLLVAVGIVTWLLAGISRKPDLPPPFPVPGWGNLTLRGVTFGTNHISPDTPPWLRLLPANARTYLAARFRSPSRLFSDRSTPEPSLLLWLELAPNTNLTTSTNPEFWLMLTDPNGVAGGQRENVFLAPGGAPSGTTASFTAFPRRAQRVQVLLISGTYSEPNILGRWDVPNPASRAYPNWPSQPLPATQQDGDVACTLNTVRIGAGSSTSYEAGNRVNFPPAQPGAPVEAVLEAVFRQAGQATNYWTLSGVLATDATGNEAKSGSMSWPNLPDRVILKWSPALWPDETWQLRLFAKRRSDAPFDTTEAVRFKGVNLGAVDVTTGLNQEITNGGATIHLTEFTLKDPPTNNSWSSLTLTQLKANLCGLTNGVYVDCLGAEDESGHRYVPVSWSSSSGSSGVQNTSYGFRDIPAQTRKLDFLFAVQRGREFTFRVRPEAIATNSPPAKQNR